MYIFSVVCFWCSKFSPISFFFFLLFTKFKGHLTMLKGILSLDRCMYTKSYTNCHNGYIRYLFFLVWSRHLRDTFSSIELKRMKKKNERMKDKTQHTATSNENCLSIRWPPCFRVKLTFYTCVLSFRKLPIIYLSARIILYSIHRARTNKNNRDMHNGEVSFFFVR